MKHAIEWSMRAHAWIRVKSRKSCSFHSNVTYPLTRVAGDSRRRTHYWNLFLGAVPGRQREQTTAISWESNTRTMLLFDTRTKRCSRVGGSVTNNFFRSRTLATSRPPEPEATMNQSLLTFKHWRIGKTLSSRPGMNEFNLFEQLWPLLSSRFGGFHSNGPPHVGTKLWKRAETFKKYIYGRVA